MNLRHSTLDLLELVQTSSGLRTVVVADPSLTVPAAVRMARGTTTVHTILYNPSLSGDALDYHISVQCGFILRQFANAPPDRVDLAGTSHGQREMEDLLRRSLGKGGHALPDTQLTLAAAHLLQGLGVQLRSMPVELRICRWLREAFPEYDGVQRAVVTRQLEENAKALGPDVRALSPAKVWRANTAMNAAVALFWAREYDDVALKAPYTKAGMSMDGLALLGIWDRAPEDATDDRGLIDAWAARLGVRDWFQWVPYDSPA